MKLDKNLSRRIKKLIKQDGICAHYIREGLDALSDISSGEAISDIPQTARQQAEKWIGGFESPPDIVILPCIGEPGRVEALLQILPDTGKLLIIERDPVSAAKLFARLPIEKLIEQKKLLLAIGENTKLLKAYLLSVLDMPKCPNIGLYDLPELDDDDKEYYKTTLLKVRDEMRVNIMNLATLIARGPLWQYNTIKNMPTLLSNPGINILKNTFEQRPALVVAAGPSLNNTLEHFKTISDRFVTISAGTALKALRRAGIKPDLVVTVDASRLTGRQFEETPCDDLFLVSSFLAFPELLPKFKGIFSGCVNANPVGRWLNSLGDDKGEILSGGTVTATGIDLAVQMGCDPIICAGLDLSVAEDGFSHADNTMYHGKQLKAEASIPVPGNYRKTVFTTSQLLVYRELITAYIKNHPEIRFINASDDGAKIEGMDLVLPQELPALAVERLDAFHKIAELHEAWKIPDMEGICGETDKMINQVKEIRDGAVKAAMTANELIVTMKLPQAGDERFVRRKLTALKRFDKKMLDSRDAAQVLEMSLRPIYYNMGRKLQSPDENYSPAVAVNRQSRELYKQMAGAASWTAELLSHALEEIRSKIPSAPMASNLHAKENQDVFYNHENCELIANNAVLS